MKIDLSDFTDLCSFSWMNFVLGFQISTQIKPLFGGAFASEFPISTESEAQIAWMCFELQSSLGASHLAAKARPLTKTSLQLSPSHALRNVRCHAATSVSDCLIWRGCLFTTMATTKDDL